MAAAGRRLPVPPSPDAPDRPRPALTLGVTGHRGAHPSFEPVQAAVAQAVAEVLDLIAGALTAIPLPAGGALAPVRMHSLLIDGADQLLAGEALARGWELVAPLPFGAALNRAINAQPVTPADARALLAGAPPQDPATAARAGAIDNFCRSARCFELAEQDTVLAAAFLATLDAPGERAGAEAFKADCSQRIAVAARLVIEQSDLMIAVWDGARSSLVGGTGHTVAAALAHGASVIWIDALAPQAWRILSSPEDLATLRAAPVPADRARQLAALVQAALVPEGAPQSGHGAVPGAPAQTRSGVDSLDGAPWQGRSDPLWHAYRRVEALFSGEPRGWRSLRQDYVTPREASSPESAPVLRAVAALPGAEAEFAARIGTAVLARQAWADAVSSRLSDCYRGGMVISFCLSAAAILGGLLYLPLVDTSWKWPFALLELCLLGAILAITWLGQARHWHMRWFETRRVAEYLRHGPLLLALGAARAPGRWPQGAAGSWPEQYARHALREPGLPQAAVTAPYLRAALSTLLDQHVVVQRDYHVAKARRLTAVHHNLDTLSERLFLAAVVSVALFLVLAAAYGAHLVDKELFKELAKLFTFLGVALPTLGGAIAGIRYFGDFERFAAISRTTADRLDSVHRRITTLLAAPDSALTYATAADLAHTADAAVFAEIENWQAVFGGKKITVPV